MRRCLTLLVVISALAESSAAEGPGAIPVPTLNWNANPGRFARAPGWVRAESAYYFVRLGEKPALLMKLLADARATGTSTIVIDNWQAPRRSGCASVSLKGAAWNATAGTSLRREDASNGKPHMVAKLSWRRNAPRGEYLQIDLASAHFIRLDARPVVMLRLRSSHAGRFVRLTLSNLEGRQWSTPVTVSAAGTWQRVGPLAPTLDARGRGLAVVRALRLEKTGTPEGAPDDVTIEIGEVQATRPAKNLLDLFVPRADLGGRAAFARAVTACRAAGGHVVLTVDAGHLPDDCRLVAESKLYACVARDAKGGPVLIVEDDGRCAFAMRGDSAWSRQLARSVSDEVIRACGVDGVCVRLPNAATEETSNAELLQRLRGSFAAFPREVAIFCDRADDASVRFADVVCGPQIDALERFTYASAGLLVDCPVRSVRTLDDVHRVIALGLKLENVATDLTTTPVAAPATLGEHKRRIASARRRCLRFFDYWRGARWRGRILTRAPGCEIYHFSSGREHLYNVVNVSGKTVGPIVLDVSRTRAGRFVDAVTGDAIAVRNGRLTITLDAHGFAMLRTDLTDALTRRDE